MDQSRDHLFRQTIRTIAFHLIKIGEAMTTYIDHFDSQTHSPHPHYHQPSHEDVPHGHIPLSSYQPSPDTPAYYYPPAYPLYHPSPLESQTPSYFPSISGQIQAPPSDHPKCHIHKNPVALPSRPNKRIRLNWTDAENHLFFETIREYANVDETVLLRRIVHALSGSRNWAQCKGHLRNLMVVGRVLYRQTVPIGWVIVEEGGKGVSPRSVVVKREGEDDEDEEDEKSEKERKGQNEEKKRQKDCEEDEEDNVTADTEVAMNEGQGGSGEKGGVESVKKNSGGGGACRGNVEETKQGDGVAAMRRGDDVGG